jgi:hypothetical protein
MQTVGSAIFGHKLFGDEDFYTGTTLDFEGLHG